MVSIDRPIATNILRGHLRRVEKGGEAREDQIGFVVKIGVISVRLDLPPSDTERPETLDAELLKDSTCRIACRVIDRTRVAIALALIS
jgi:hypothetical protein